MNSRDSYSLILVGTGFASSFFLDRYLKRADAGERVLVLERGPRTEHRDQLKMSIPEFFAEGARTFVNRTPEKPWVFRILFGGSSNCWVGQVPRMLPEDFELQSRYGVGVDWPLGYDELEPYYCDVEEAMDVAGPSDDSPYRRSRPYPQPPHRQSDPDLLLKRAWPDDFFVVPAARPSLPTRGRPRCCASNVCPLCPVDAKFTVLNSALGNVYRDPRVSLLTGARVETVEHEAGRATGVSYEHKGRTHTVRGDLVALGAHAIMNPFLLLRSGLTHPRLGRGLAEDVAVTFDVDLDGVDNFQGSTIFTGHGYMLHRGDRLRHRAPALMNTRNAPVLRQERGKWRQRLSLGFNFADLPRMDNLVRPSAEEPDKPEVVYRGHSDYTERAIEAIPAEVEGVLATLPVEKIHPLKRVPTQFHVECTVPMGHEPETSVVDRYLAHHRLRNLLVLGSSAFPTAPPANPTLTLSALSLWAADHLFGGRRA